MKRYGQNLALNVMLLALGALQFASKDTRAGAGGTNTATASKGATKTASKGGDNGGAANGQTTTEAVTGAATEQAAPKRPPTTINSLEDLNKLPQTERDALIKASQVRAAAGAGTQGVYIKEDGTETTNKEEAKRAQQGKGRVIAKYTAPRPGDVVAVEELTRMLRLPWSIAARQAVNERMKGRKTPLDEAELIKILNANNAPESYMRPKASKKLFGRVLAFIQAGPLPEKGQEAQDVGKTVIAAETTTQ